MLTLIDVISKTATASEDTFELVVSVSGYEGNAEPAELPYGWRAGDPHGLGPQLDAWMATHPDFPVAPYVPPTPSTDPADYPLTPAQFKAMIEISGYGTDVDTAIAAIADPIDRAVARSKYLYSTTYRRDNPIIAMLQPAVGITDVELDALWMTAKDLTP